MPAAYWGKSQPLARWIPRRFRFDRSRFGKEPLTFPDRVRLTVEAIEAGTHAMFLGGWLSFTGQLGKAGWGRLRLAEVLPVECQEVDDLIESTEGYCMSSVSPSHPVLKGIDLRTAPPILGYNRTQAKPNAQVVATWSGTNDPALVVATHGQGRVAAYTSDPAPHWGCNFVYWQQYATLWRQTLAWLLTGQ